MFIPDPGSEFFHPGSRIIIFSIQDPGSASKNFKYFNPLVSNSPKYDPGCSSRIRILISYPSWIPDPRVKRHQIQDPGSGSANTANK